MNNSNVLFPNIIRFIVLALVQVVLMRQLSLTGSGYLNIFLYPIFIMYLPLAINVPFVIFLSFLLGLSVDLFYGSIGVHAAASVFSGWARSYLIRTYEPRGGYASNVLIPSKGWLGGPWFLRYAAIFMALHIFFYFSVDAFTFVYLGTITMKSLVCWLLSMLFVLFYSTILNPKE